MKTYKVWIQIEEIDESQDHYSNACEPYEAGRFDSEADAVEFVENELMATHVTGSAADLLEACKALTSYTSELLYNMDNQVDLSEIEEIQQAKDAIAGYRPVKAPCARLRNACQQVLETLDAGGEQSRAFADEIKMLRAALKASPQEKAECPECGCRF